MIAGSMVALVTPMDAQGNLDWDSLGKLVDFHLQEGTNAIVAVGTTGESATLDVEEHIEVIEFVVKRVAGRIAVIAGTWLAVAQRIQRRAFFRDRTDGQFDVLALAVTNHFQLGLAAGLERAHQVWQVAD